MEERYDVAVVGAGLGGLTAAVILAREGLDVVLLDRNGVPGGTARGFRRGRFTFPAGPLGFSCPGEVERALPPGALPHHPTLERVAYRVRAGGIDVPLSLGFQKESDALNEKYPGEEKAVRSFFDDAAVVVRALESAPPGSPPALGDLGRLSASEYLAALTNDRRLVGLLGGMGASEPSFGFPMAARMWDLLSEKGIWYPGEGFNSLASSLASSFSGRGGRLRMSTEVSHISVTGGAVTGVRLAGGDSIRASAVVSNADFKSTYMRLIDPAVLPGEWLDAVASARLTSSNLQVALGVDSTRVDLSAFAESSRIIYMRYAPAGDAYRKPAWEAPEIDPDDLAGQELELALWSAHDRSLAPPGADVVVIRTGADHSHFTRFRPGFRKRSPEYKAYKARLAQALVAEAGRVLTGLEEAVEVVDVATPLTFEERGGRYAGAVAGWSQRHEDVSDYSVRSLVLTPVKGLYAAGYQAFSWLYWGGVPSAVLSGAEAARAVLRGDGPVSAVTIPAS